mgnify:FL=1
MESWYLPITLLPSIGFFIMATTNVSNALSGEITQMLALDTSYLQSILSRKINQLRLLSVTLVLLYGSAILLAVSGLVAGLGQGLMVHADQLVFVLICLGILAVCCALSLLMIYAVRAVRIKRDQFER